MASGGRPTKLNASTTKAIVDALRSGAYASTAASFAGVDPATYHRWLKRGADEAERRERIEEEREREKEEDKKRARSLRVEERTRRKQRDDEDRKKRRSEGPYLRFRDAVEKAMADSEVGALGVIGAVARGRSLKSRTVRRDPNGGETISEEFHRSEWTAAAWLLERRHPGKYGRATRIEHTGKDGGPVALTIADLVRDAFNAEADDD